MHMYKFLKLFIKCIQIQIDVKMRKNTMNSFSTGTTWLRKRYEMVLWSIITLDVK